ncbi:hypothetical protein [Amycolatopsis sp. NPDC004625]|uniref:hypothetical protein n=1 Tax=Amycolatopsis sp. NPDC004625 TaxID=3154670 RepID=UPI0033A6D14B
MVVTMRWGTLVRLVGGTVLATFVATILLFGGGSGSGGEAHPAPATRSVTP